MAQNNVTIQRQWSKVFGQTGANPTGSLDALFQLFTQLNAVINDTQNQVYSSASVTGAGVTVPTITSFRALAGGTYILSGTGPLAALAGPVIPVSSFGMWWYTVDASLTFRTYNSAANGGTILRTALTFPTVLPGAGEVVFGFTEVATDGTHTFTPATTNFNAAGITTTHISLTGDTGFTAFTMVEQDNA